MTNTLEFSVNDTVLQLSDTSTILDLKKHIIEKETLSCPYVDIVFCLEKPMRTSGKFNVEPGPVTRMFDRHTLDRFAFKERVEVTYTEVPDYTPDKPKQAFLSGGRGRGRGRSGGRGIGLSMTSSLPNLSTFDSESAVVDMNIEPTFVLQSEEDFPSL
jgi:hypothetical protein